MIDFEINHFLVTYDARKHQASVRAFGTHYDAALEAYAEAEDGVRGRAYLDIVLLSADSLETIKRTHSSYFDGAGRTFERLLPPGVLAQ